MKINPTRILSDNEFLSCMGYTKGIPIGQTVTPPMKGFQEFMRRWTYRIDEKMLKVREGSPIYMTLKNERGFSYEEYKLLFSSIDEEKYHLYPVFDAMMVVSRDMLVELRIHFDESEEGYFRALQYCVQNREMKGLQYFMGKMSYELPLDDLKRHAYISGSTGSGKSQLLRIIFYWLHAMSRRDSSMSVVLLDPHDDLTQEIKTSNLSYEDKERFILIDPEMRPGLSPVINPLDVHWETDNDVVNHAQNLSIAIENTVGTSLSQNMNALLVPCLALLIRKKNATFLDLVKLMENDPDLIEEGKQLKNEVHRSLFVDFHKKYKQSKPAISSRFQSFLNFPSFSHIISGPSTIDLEKEINSGKVIVVNLSQRYFGEEGSPALGRFLIAMIKSIALKRGNKLERKPTFLLVDECQNFVSNSINTILRQTRKFGLHLLLANQSVEDLDSIREVVLSNTAVKCVGTNGSPETLKVLAASTGTSYETLVGLNKYHFYIKSLSSSGVIVKPSDILMRDPSFSITAEQELELEEYTVAKYYKDFTVQTPVPMDDGAQDSNDEESGTSSSLTKFDL